MTAPPTCIVCSLEAVKLCDEIMGLPVLIGGCLVGHPLELGRLFARLWYRSGDLDDLDPSDPLDDDDEFDQEPEPTDDDDSYSDTEDE